MPLLWLVAGTIGVVVATGNRGAALREWRWLIVEPLLFYALVHWYGRMSRWRTQLLWAWLLAGVLVAVVGILQVPDLNLAPLLAQSACFSADVVAVEGVRRATSVYCHPNNLGLALGRVWPVLASLALLGAAAPSSLQRVSRGAGRRRGRAYNVLAEWSVNRLGLALLPALLAAIVLAGIVASFSRGAIVGGVVALIVLGIVLRRRVLLALATGMVILGLVAMFATGIERFNPLGGSSSARLELWSSASAMLRDHPLTGVGLDQFYHLRNATPGGGRYISRAAAASSELYASHPHNAVLDILLRTGPFGLAVMLLLIVHFYRTALRLLRSTDLPRRALIAGLLASMCGALVHGLLDNFYFVADLALVFWTQLALVELLMHEHRETEFPPAKVRP